MKTSARDADGYEGYVPASAVYTGDGKFSFIGSPLPRGYYRTHERLAQTDFSRLNRTGDNEADLAHSPESFGLSSALQGSAYENSNADCSITVRIIGPETKTFDTAMGTYTQYGFGFEVTGRVKSSRVGHVGDPHASPRVLKEVKGNLHNGGRWTVGQWIHPIEVEGQYQNGDRLPPNGFNPLNVTTDDSPRPWSRHIRGRNFSWRDSPGILSPPDNPLVSGHTSANFLVYAQNGKKRCAVGFHIEGTFANGRWGAQISPLR